MALSELEPVRGLGRCEVGDKAAVWLGLRSQPYVVRPPPTTSGRRREMRRCFAPSEWAYGAGVRAARKQEQAFGTGLGRTPPCVKLTGTVAWPAERRPILASALRRAGPWSAAVQGPGQVCAVAWRRPLVSPLGPALCRSRGREA